ncbi:hypothetical protein WDV06_34765 [Streptomyces racemochromogenes]|uniref:DUF7691 domain-containing protein n=1 Tax=Streptomyces racemochromogenes TaxID=67353 RepID=A0ABW7PRC4_9ACTN
MGHLVMSTGSMRDAMRLLTAVERTPEQERTLVTVREQCRTVDGRLHAQGIDLDVSVAQALEELLDGAVTAERGPGYHYALHALISPYFSDTHDLGEWRRQSWFWTVDEEVSRTGLPARLALSQILLSGPPVRLPPAGDSTPWMGTFPTELAAEFVAAHEAVLGRLDPEVRETVEVFLKAIRCEAEAWASTAEGLRSRQDTMFFWCS